MSYTYLPEQGEESLAESFADIPASVLSKLNLTAEPSYCSDSEMECCQDFLSGMTCAPSTVDPGAERSISSAADSHAKTSVALDAGQVSTANDQGFGWRWRESLAKYDRVSRLWKTRQCLLFEDSTECLEILPRWGMTRDGECFPLESAVLNTRDRACSYMPTIMKTLILETDIPHHVISESGYIQKTANTGNVGCANWGLWMLLHSVIPTPRAAEYFMGWPMEWTALQPLAMDKFQRWLRWHGKC